MSAITTNEPAIKMPSLFVRIQGIGSEPRIVELDDPRAPFCRAFNEIYGQVGLVAEPVTEPAPPLMVEVVGGNRERMVVAFDDPRQTFCEDYAKTCEAGRTVRILHNPTADDIAELDFRRSSFAAAATEGGGK